MAFASFDKKYTPFDMGWFMQWILESIKVPNRIAIPSGYIDLNEQFSQKYAIIFL